MGITFEKATVRRPREDGVGWLRIPSATGLLHVQVTFDEREESSEALQEISAKEVRRTSLRAWS